MGNPGAMTARSTLFLAHKVYRFVCPKNASFPWRKINFK